MIRRRPPRLRMPALLRRIRLWPRGLVGQVMVVLLAAVLLEFLGSTAFYEQAQTYSADDAQFFRMAEQLAIDMRLLNATAPERRPDFAAMLSTMGLALRWTPASPVPPEAHGLHPLHRRLASALQPFGAAPLRLVAQPARSRELAGVLTLRDGSQLHFTAWGLMQRHTVTRGLMSASILAGCVILVAAMLVRSLSLPLRALARVADSIGRGPPVMAAEDGPHEVRHLGRALNAMQGRIARLIADRTEALAAVSHDLRTPLARLRLRAGFLEPDAQGAIEADLDEMEAMVGSVLSFLAGEADSERRRTVDLAALLATLVDHEADAGRDARYVGPDQATITVRPLAMKRVFANLISNAIAYGGSAIVTLERAGTGLRVLVEDDGPGIPEAELERVTTPFYRLDASRSRATGGMGLGLAIVQREVAREGGRLTLSNRTPHGLRVEIVLT